MTTICCEFCKQPATLIGAEDWHHDLFDLDLQDQTYSCTPCGWTRRYIVGVPDDLSDRVTTQEQVGHLLRLALNSRPGMTAVAL